MDIRSLSFVSFFCYVQTCCFVFFKINLSISRRAVARRDPLSGRVKKKGYWDEDCRGPACCVCVTSGIGEDEWCSRLWTWGP